MPCLGVPGIRYELFDANINFFEYESIYVVGLGGIGKEVVSLCESMSMIGLNYNCIDENVSH